MGNDGVTQVKKRIVSLMRELEDDAQGARNMGANDIAGELEVIAAKLLLIISRKYDGEE